MAYVNTNPSLIEALMNKAQGAAAQINPWDNGATYKSVVEPYEKEQRMAESRKRQANTPQRPQRQGPQLHTGTAKGRGPEGYIDWSHGAYPEPTPFRMFEDGTFEGNPNLFKDSYPEYQFFEDNSFRGPQPKQAQQMPYEREAMSQPRLQQDPLAQLRQLLGF